MQNSLWKVGALLGVIGSGFLVLMKAQEGVTRGGAASDGAAELSGAEQFTEMEAIEDLAAMSAGQSPEPSTSESLNRSDRPGLTALAPFEQPTAAEPELEPEPTPTAARGGDISAVPANPFASSFGDAASESASDAAADAPADTPAADESNPFANLVRSLTDNSGPQPADDEPTTIATGSTFNPFSPESASDPEPVPTSEDDQPPAQQEPEAATEFAAADDSTLDDIFPSSEAETGSRAPKQYEPTALTPLPEGAPGPTLMVPPAAALQEPLGPQPADTALYEVPAEGEPSSTEQIVQVGQEQRAPWEQGNSADLVFPGADPEPQRPFPSRSAAAASSLPSIEPQGATGAAWLSDETPATAPRDVVPLPDGTVEMTIKPRGSDERAPLPAQPATEVRPGGFNPFATVPEIHSSRPATARQPEPAPFDIQPATRPDTSQPRYPDPGLSFSKGPIQPSGAELPADPAAIANPLTPADYTGIGTVSPDTPSTPQQAQLTIEKQAPENSVLGQDLIYSILVQNVGRSPAKNVLVEDLVPRGSELKGTDPQAQMTQDKRLIWQLGTMEPGAQRTIRIKVVPTEAGQIGSVATVSFEAAVASRTVITAPELRLAMNGPTEVRIGEKAPYKFTLTNSGSADATNVFIRSIIPEGFEHPAARQQNGVTDIEYEVGSLPRGQSREIELTLLAVAEGDFQNHSILTADGNVNVEAHQPVRVIDSRLKVQREGPANRFVGAQAAFINTVSNESTQLLKNITVTESLPLGVKFVQASDNGYFNAQERTVTWQLTTLEPGAVRRLQTVVVAEQPGQLASTVRATDSRGDTAETATQLLVAGFSSLTVDVANPGRPIPVGEEVALRLKVRNGGTAAANAVETRIQLPAELRFVSARGPVRYAQQGQWIAFEPIGRIDVQGEQSFDIVLVAAAASDDARVVVQLTSDELSKPLSEDESVVIFADAE